VAGLPAHRIDYARRVLRVAWVVDLAGSELASAVTDLRGRSTGAGLVDAGAPGSVADLRAADAVVVWVDRPVRGDLAAALADPAVRCVLAGPTLTDGDPDGVLGGAAGLLVEGVTPVHDARIRAGRDAIESLRPRGHGHQGPEGTHDHDHVVDRIPLATAVGDDVRVLLTARIGLAEQPVLTWRPSTSTAAWTLGATPGAIASQGMTRTLVALVRLACGQPEAPPVRVGLLGYGAIGHEHSRAVRATPGLTLAAVCDSSPERRAASVAAAPGVATTDSADGLIERDDVDLVVISTPPDSHARWALRAIDAGRDVVIEKPLAIDTASADAVLTAADAAGRLAVVYQNRRYDPDHVAVRRLVRSGTLGDVFSIETFIGGYGHPCNLWHSDAAVSGGALYDWGSHVLDQILDLVPGEVEAVTATSHKRRWFDVTNADHARVTMRFSDGVEAEFVQSHLAAALKPRWYVLGTLGAIVGHWRTERVISRSDIGTLVEDVLAPADSPPLLDVHAADGSVTRLAVPAPEPYPFHRELADRLRLGLPMTVTGAQSRRVLAVIEAATASAAAGGRAVTPT
jgi:predicted dehydrogenase